MPAEIPATLQTLLADILEVSPLVITAAAGPSSIASWDSFRHLQIVLALEGEYQVQFDPARIPALDSVAVLIAELRSLGADLAFGLATGG